MADDKRPYRSEPDTNAGAQAERTVGNPADLDAPLGLEARSAGSREYPTPRDDARAWEVTKGASWQETGADSPAIHEDETGDVSRASPHRLVGGGAINDQDRMEEPEAPEAVRSGPRRVDPEE